MWVVSQSATLTNHKNRRMSKYDYFHEPEEPVNWLNAILGGVAVAGFVYLMPWAIALLEAILSQPGAN